MPKQVLLLWLEAPLQSWGHDSRFGVRDTLPFPTKSGVIGLICCALGKREPKSAFLTELTESTMEVKAYKTAKSLPDNNNFAFILRDFQTVGTNLNDSDPFENLMIPKKSDGTKPVNSSGAVITYRYAIQNGKFAVLLEYEAELAARIYKALLQPKWDLYLGRKAYIPTEIIAQGLFDDKEDALIKLSDIVKYKDLIETFSVIEGEHPEAGDTMILNDVPLSLGLNKSYGKRYVTMIQKED